MMYPQRTWQTAAIFCAVLLGLNAGLARGDYVVQRVRSGLNQPTDVVQAPGDPTSLYVVERNDGGSVVGRIRRYDLLSDTLTTFLDMPGTVVQDGGLISMTFHPDYQTNGLFYVLGTNSTTNALDEYKTVGGVPQLQRRILQYPSLANVFHTIDQAHFRPGGNNNELFVLTGDGGTQANQGSFNPALIEDPNSIYGKIMRIDLTASFPTPAVDATHGGIDVVALGIRNPYRSSFDRSTGDFYFGDVGFNAAEEVNFIPAGHFANPAAAPLNFGWPQREGTIRAPGTHGADAAPGDLNPIFDYPHPGVTLPHSAPFNGLAVIGGYVYRGPVTELQGRYFFAEHIFGNVYSGLFNTSTPTTSYNGTNVTGVVDHTVDYENRIGGGANIQFITSYGEDLLGNLYIVKVGTATCPACPLGSGEIFRVMPTTPLVAEVNRVSGRISLTNTGATNIALSSLAIRSAFGALNPAVLTPITGNYDVNGDGTVDDNSPWSVSSLVGSYSELREMSLGDPGAIEPGEIVYFSLDDGWIPSPTEDVVFAVLLDNGAVINPRVVFNGHGGVPFRSSDFNFDNVLTELDWDIFKDNHGQNLSGLSLAEAYAFGDLTADGKNDFLDFRRFQADYIAANGPAAFEALGATIPEPSALLLTATSTIFLAARRRRQRATRVKSC